MAVFVQLTSLLSGYPGGVIEMIVPVLAGPTIWFIAVLITPFGLPPFNLDEVKVGRAGFTRIQS